MSAEKLSIGVAGLGGWGKNVVRSFASAPRCDLKYVCDASPDSLRKHQALFPKATATDSFQTLLDDDSLDAVAIVTPAPMHYGMAKAALEAVGGGGMDSGSGGSASPPLGSGPD